MPKHLLKKYIPTPEKIKQSKLLAILGSQIHDPELWHLHRFSVARAFFNGLFWAAIPIPMQMLCAALVAIPLRANIPLSVSLVWVSNPITMPFVFYINYLIGEMVIQSHQVSEFKLSVEWIWKELENIWLPLYVGSLISGLVVGGLSYILVLVYWRYNVNKRWNARKLRKKKEKQD